MEGNMKKVISLIVTFVLLLISLAYPLLSYAAWTYSPTITVDGEIVNVVFDYAPVFSDGDLLAPARASSELLGLYVSWDEESNMLIYNNYLFMIVDSPVAYVGSAGENPISVPTPVRTINGRTMAPLKFIAEQFGYQCTFDETNNLIDIIINGITTNKWEGSLSFKVNGVIVTEHQIDVPPRDLDGVTMFPLRFAVEYFGGYLRSNLYNEQDVSLTYKNLV